MSYIRTLELPSVDVRSFHSSTWRPETCAAPQREDSRVSIRAGVCIALLRTDGRRGASLYEENTCSSHSGRCRAEDILMRMEKGIMCCDVLCSAYLGCRVLQVEVVDPRARPDVPKRHDPGGGGSEHRTVLGDLGKGAETAGFGAAPQENQRGGSHQPCSFRTTQETLVTKGGRGGRGGREGRGREGGGKGQGRQEGEDVVYLSIISNMRPMSSSASPMGFASCTRRWAVATSLEAGEDKRVSSSCCGWVRGWVGGEGREQEGRDRDGWRVGEQVTRDGETEKGGIKRGSERRGKRARMEGGGRGAKDWRG